MGVEENKEKDLQVIMGEKTLRQKIIILQVIATTTSRKDIEKQNVILNSVTTQTMLKKKNML